MKKSEKTELTREKILNAAIAEFGANGYDGGTINQICAGNHISKGLIYHNFVNKEDLYLCCAERVIHHFVEYIRKRKEEDDLQQYMMLRDAFFSANPMYARVFFEVILQPPKALAEPIREIKKPLDDLNREIYQAAVRKLHLREGVSEEAAMEYYRMVLVMFNGYFSSPAYAGADMDDIMNDHEKKLLQILDLVLYGIAREE